MPSWGIGCVAPRSEPMQRSGGARRAALCVMLGRAFCPSLTSQILDFASLVSSHPLASGGLYRIQLATQTHEVIQGGKTSTPTRSNQANRPFAHHNLEARACRSIPAAPSPQPKHHRLGGSGVIKMARFSPKRMPFTQAKYGMRRGYD